MSDITIVGDLHCKPSNLDKINELFDFIEELGNPVVQLGDVFDTKETIKGRCLNTVYQRLKVSKLTWFILTGNHDQFNLHTSEHSLETLKELPNVTIIDRPMNFSQPFRFSAIPYIHDLEKTKNAVNSMDRGLPLFMHTDMISFDYGNGIISKSGLRTEDFTNFPIIISGHYHSFQIDRNFAYLGTPFSHSFGETDQYKYIGILDTESNHLNLLESPFPRHMTYEVNCDEKELLKVNEKDYNRVILKGSKENIKKYPRVSGIKYIEKPKNDSKISFINESQSLEKQFETWGKDVKKWSNSIIGKGLELLK